MGTLQNWIEIFALALFCGFLLVRQRFVEEFFEDHGGILEKKDSIAIYLLYSLISIWMGMLIVFPWRRVFGIPLLFVNLGIVAAVLIAGKILYDDATSHS
jgi:hypothetical protein